MVKNKEKCNNIIVLSTTILLYLVLTRLNEFSVFKYLLLCNYIVSFLIVIYQSRNDFSINYFKNNFFLILILLFCGISIVYHGFILNCVKDYVYIIYFLVIVGTLIKKDKKIIKEASKYIFYLCLSINVISMILAILESVGITLLPFNIVESANGSFNYYGLYSNPNSLGLGTMIALILFNTFCKKKKNYPDIIFIVVLLVFIIMSGSRASLISVVVYYLIRCLIKQKRVSKDIIAKTFVVILLSFFCLVSIMSTINNDYHQSELVGFEKTINKLTTKRYTLWKYSILAMNSPGKIMFGLSLFDIGEERLMQIPNEMYNNYDQFTKNLVQSNNNHNGYVQFFTSYGIICMGLVIVWIYFGIINSDYKVIPIIIALLCLNMFESEFINSHSLSLFLLCYFLYFKKSVIPFNWIKKLFKKIELLCIVNNKKELN